MVSHFQVKPLYQNNRMPGWHISFYMNRVYYEADYLKDGQIVWKNAPSNQIDETQLIDYIHELMLFHVYE
ncbi:YheE family protein [Priestia megaterium]|uniref:YheE family protein n=1 Tax=Priestia megaterium TaxID=1404 RepID=UPI002E21A70C|nr:YheE family protein [Priestia megaterium]